MGYSMRIVAVAAPKYAGAIIILLLMDVLKGNFYRSILIENVYDFLRASDS